MPTILPTDDEDLAADERRLTLRISRNLYDELLALAEDQDRSLQKQAVRLLKQALRAQRGDVPVPEN